jgi:hypothetical protein
VLRAHDPGGLEVLSANLDAFHAALTFENHTLKRALTDPRLFSGIGNAYSELMNRLPRFSAGRNIAIRIPSHEFSRTVEFYRDIIGLPLIQLSKRKRQISYLHLATRSYGLIRSPTSARQKSGWRSAVMTLTEPGSI